MVRLIAIAGAALLNSNCARPGEGVLIVLLLVGLVYTRDQRTKRTGEWFIRMKLGHGQKLGP